MLDDVEGMLSLKGNKETHDSFDLLLHCIFRSGNALGFTGGCCSLVDPLAFSTDKNRVQHLLTIRDECGRFACVMPVQKDNRYANFPNWNE